MNFVIVENNSVSMAQYSNGTINSEYAEECHECGEKFALSGSDPVTLLCGHSLCGDCIQCVSGNNGDKIELCSQCEEKEENDKIPVKDTEEVPEKDKEENIPIQEERPNRQKPKMEVCKVHKRQISFYCNNPSCQKEICQLCMIEEHKKHEFLDLQNLQEEKRKILLENTETLKKDIQKNKLELLQTKDSLSENLKTCTKKIEEEKNNKVNTVTRIVTQKYDQLLESVTSTKTEEIQTIENDVKIFDQQISELEDIEENMDGEGKKLEDIESKNKLFSDIVAQMREKSAPRCYKNFEHKDKHVTTQEVENLCGDVDEKKIHIQMFKTLNSHLLVSASQLKCSGR